MRSVYSLGKKDKALIPIALIIQMSWVILMIGSLNFEQRDTIELIDNAFSVGIIHRVVAFILVSLAIAIILVERRGKINKGIPINMALFGFWRLLSTFWSSYPAITFYKSMEYIGVAVLLALTIDYHDNKQRMYDLGSLFWFWVGGLLSSAYIGLLLWPEKALKSFPGAALPVALNGVIPRIHNSWLGELGGILAIVSLCRLQFSERHKVLWYLGLTFGVISLILAQGRAAFFAFLISLCIILIIQRRFILLSVILLITLVIVISPLTVQISQYFLRGQSLQLFLSLSTRISWWRSVFRLNINSNPIIGHGGFVGGRIFAPMYFGMTDTRLAIDNAWIEIFLNTGVIGLLIFLSLVVRTLYFLLRGIRDGNSSIRMLSMESFGVFVLLLIRSFFVSTISLHLAFPLLFVIATAEFARRSL